jgi:hypothetical protein
LSNWPTNDPQRPAALDGLLGQQLFNHKPVDLFDYYSDFAIFSLILLKERLDDASFADQESDADRGVPAFFDKMLVALAILRFMVASTTESSLGGRDG